MVIAAIAITAITGIAACKQPEVDDPDTPRLSIQGNTALFTNGARYECQDLVTDVQRESNKAGMSPDMAFQQITKQIQSSGKRGHHNTGQSVTGQSEVERAYDKCLAIWQPAPTPTPNPLPAGRLLYPIAPCDGLLLDYLQRNLAQPAQYRQDSGMPIWEAIKATVTGIQAHQSDCNADRWNPEPAPGAVDNNAFGHATPATEAMATEAQNYPDAPHLADDGSLLIRWNPEKRPANGYTVWLYDAANHTWHGGY